MDVFELKSNGPRKVSAPHGLETKNKQHCQFVSSATSRTYHSQLIPFSLFDICSEHGAEKQC